MKGTMKTVIVAGIVGALALAATAFGQAPTQPPPGAEREKTRPKACGRPGVQHLRGWARLVHSETKVQVKEGFALLIADRGTIADVDSSARKVTIERADGEKLTVVAGERTQICRNGEPATVDQLQTGDRAGILQMERDGERVVKAIRAFSADLVPQAEQARNRARPAGAEQAGTRRPKAEQAETRRSKLDRTGLPLPSGSEPKRGS